MAHTAKKRAAYDASTRRGTLSKYALKLARPNRITANCELRRYRSVGLPEVRRNDLRGANDPAGHLRR